MKKSIFILLAILSIFLAACAPQVTVTPQATVTLTPPPTATVIPTPTLHPQFIALQESIAASGERFTLNPDGTVQDGTTTIPGLQVGKDGKITITVNGELVEIDPASMNFDDEKGLSIEGFEYDDGDGDWEVAIKEYPVCTPEKFRDCELPVEDLFNGNYLAHLRTLSQPFDPSKFKDPMPKMEILSDGAMVYDVSTAPNFENPETAPFRRNVTAGMAKGSDGRMYLVLPIEYPDPSDPTNPEKNVWVIGIRNEFNPRTGENVSENLIVEDLYKWTERMNIAPIKTELVNPNSGTIDELANITFSTHPDMEQRFADFMNGDTTALDGLVVEIKVTKQLTEHWYE